MSSAVPLLLSLMTFSSAYAQETDLPRTDRPLSRPERPQQISSSSAPNVVLSPDIPSKLTKKPDFPQPIPPAIASTETTKKHIHIDDAEKNTHRPPKTLQDSFIPPKIQGAIIMPLFSEPTRTGYRVSNPTDLNPVFSLSKPSSLHILTSQSSCRVDPKKTPLSFQMAAKETCSLIFQHPASHPLYTLKLQAPSFSIETDIPSAP